MSPFVARLNQRRMTLTPPPLNRARDIRRLVSGADKAPVPQQVLQGRDLERLPVQLVVPESGRLIWLVDHAAAARLTAR
jgi:6-phosphogluconolactonase